MEKETLREKIKLRDRCAVLVEIAKNLASIYDSPSASETPRHYIETILGAAIWYLPTSKELWNGKVSLRVLEDFHPASAISKPRMTEDHEYPRKVSAIELMRRSWSAEATIDMLELYLTKYGRFSYINPTENKVLVKHQKSHIFDNPEAAYVAAGIKLVSVSLDELKQIKKRNTAVIESCISRAKYSCQLVKKT